MAGSPAGGAGSGDLPGAGQGSSPPGGMGITSQGFGQEGYVLEQVDPQLPKPPPEADNFSVGVPYYLPFATPYRDSWEVFREDPVTIRQLISMRRQDGQARALYRLLTKPILAALKNADFIPVDGQTGGTAEAQFARDMFFQPASMGGMEFPFIRVIKQMLLALFNGFTAWEMIYWVPQRGPLKGKVTIRALDWRPAETLTFLLDGQGRFNGFRQRCLTADTRVSQLDGTEVRIDEMVRRHQAGEEQWVYSCTKDGRVVPGKVRHAWKNRDSAPLVEVELDNGEKVRCTPDHPWMLRDGTYRWAERLKPGDSLMPLYRKSAPVQGSMQRYEHVQHPVTGAWETTHRMVARNLGFGARGDEVIHHGFEGLKHRNNDPSNLHCMTRAAHCELHARLGQLRRSSVELAHIEDAARELRIATGARPTRAAVAAALGCSERLIRNRVKAAGIASWSAVCRGIEGHELTFGYVDDVARAMAAAGERLTLSRLAAKLSWSEGSVFREIQAAGFSGWMEYRRSLKGKQPVITMAVIEETARRLHREGVSPDRALVEQELGCSYKVLKARLQEAGYGSWTEYKATVFGIPRNHTVRAVRSVPNEAVYDLEVEEYHNFALTAGVFISNTFFQGRTIDVKIPRDTAIYYAHEEAERPFYGVSMFESAFYHYDKKVKLYYIAHLAAQRAAVGLRVGTMAPSPHIADRSNFTKALANMGMAGYIVLPSSDWTVTSLKETGTFDYLGLINHHNSQMSKSVLAEWFDNAQGGGDGDSSLVDFGKQSDVTFMMMLEGIMEEMAQIIDHDIVPRFIDWNFGSQKYPQFKWGELTAEQKAAVQNVFDTLAAAGQQANVTPQFMLELEKRLAEDLGLDIDYDTIEKQREQQQAAMESQFGAGGAPGYGEAPTPPSPDQEGIPPGQQGAPPQGGSPGGGIPPNLLPQGFQSVQAAARQAVDGVFLSLGGDGREPG